MSISAQGIALIVMEVAGTATPAVETAIITAEATMASGTIIHAQTIVVSMREVVEAEEAITMAAEIVEANTTIKRPPHTTIPAMAMTGIMCITWRAKEAAPALDLSLARPGGHAAGASASASAACLVA